VSAAYEGAPLYPVHTAAHPYPIWALSVALYLSLHLDYRCICDSKQHHCLLGPSV
jgi:hypothetical protein